MRDSHKQLGTPDSSQDNFICYHWLRICFFLWCDCIWGTSRRSSRDTCYSRIQAIRAIRHPERYGPRPADPTLGGGQSRAGGIGRAILDTFPVVKFGSSSGNDPRPKDIESAPMATGSSIPVPSSDSVQLAQLGYAAEHSQHNDLLEVPITPTTDQGAREDNQASEGTDQVDPLPRINTADSASPRNIVPECIGRETCPICIVDFEEGDDLRVLPCEGKHRFHQSCVDPWLLELSGSCPLCRQGKTTFGRLGNRRLMRITHQISMRWRRSYLEDRETKHPRSTVTAHQVHLYNTTVGFLVICDSPWDASKQLVVENEVLHHRQNLESISRRMYSSDDNLSKWHLSVRRSKTHNKVPNSWRVL